jgi:hypothetical protein
MGDTFGVDQRLAVEILLLPVSGGISVRKMYEMVHARTLRSTPALPIASFRVATSVVSS